MTRFLKLTLIVSLLALAAPAAHAQGLIIPSPAPDAPGPDAKPIPLPRPIPVRVRPAQSLALRSQKVTMQINSGALKVDVEQVFYNPNSNPMQGTYLFPLPEGAAVSNFRMLVDKEPVEGKVLNVEQARKVYESYVRQNVDPAILEYVGRNAFQARIFPIPGGGERRIYLSYSQAAEFNNGIYKAVYPLNSERVTGQTLGDLAVECSIKSAQPLKAIYSPTHEIQVKRESDHQARAFFEGKDVRANKDFILYYSTSDKAFGLNALSHRRIGEEGYVMMMLAPKREVASSEVQPKDVVLILDTSGSMQGAKIEQAKKAAHSIISALNEQDRFNIVRFSSDTTNFRPTVVPAVKENRDAARMFVDEFKAVGGTAIDDALQAGLASLPSEAERKGRAPFLIFMTDGLPTIGITEVDRILGNAEKAAPKDLRMFAFGVGSDVNTLLLDRLARDNRGMADYVAAEEDLENKIGSFYAKISDPVLSNVQVQVAGATLKDVYPNKIPDLFAGSQLLVLARYQGQGKASVTLTGEVNGKPQKFNYDLTLPERELGQEFIPKLWAGRRIGFLLEEIRLHGESKELKDEVIRLSKEHGILTPYTAYLVEEPGLTPPVATNLGVRTGVDFYGTVPESRAGLSGGLGGGGFGRPAVPGIVDRDGRYVKRESLNRSRGEIDKTEGKRQPSGSQDGAAGGRTPVGKPATNPDPAPAKAASPARPATPEELAKKDENYRFYDAGSLDARRKMQLQSQVRQQSDGYYRSTGQNAVEASRRLNQLKEKQTEETELEVSRNVEGRMFRFTKGAWVDQTATGKITVVPVKYGSEAYFQLVARKKEWARFLSVGREVTFKAGSRTAVQISDKGKEKLTEAELKALEK